MNRNLAVEMDMHTIGVKTGCKVVGSFQLPAALPSDHVLGSFVPPFGDLTMTLHFPRT